MATRAATLLQGNGKRHEVEKGHPLLIDRRLPHNREGVGGKLDKSSGLIGKRAYSKVNTMLYVSHLPVRSSVSLSGNKMCFLSKSRATQAIYMNK